MFGKVFPGASCSSSSWFWSWSAFSLWFRVFSNRCCQVLLLWLRQEEGAPCFHHVWMLLLGQSALVSPPRSGEWIGFYGPDLLVWWLAAPSASTEPVLR